MRSCYLLVALPLMLAACAGGRAVSDWPVKIGQPYRVRGVTYVPAAAPGYAAVGTRAGTAASPATAPPTASATARAG